jgi:hypothetical protein
MRDELISREIEILRERIHAADREAEFGRRVRQALALLTAEPPDPANSLTESRNTIEYLVDQLHEAYQIPRRGPLNDRVRTLFTDATFASDISDHALATRLRLSLDKIRELGNVGAHSRSVRVVDAVRVLQEVMDLFDWYVDMPKRLRVQHRDALSKFQSTQYDQARQIWIALDRLGDRLPHDLRFEILYNLACTDTRIAERFAAANAVERKSENAPSADTAFSWLKQCIDFGNSIGWAELGPNADAAMASISKDNDLLFLRGRFEDRIHELLQPTKYASSYEKPAKASGERTCVAAGSLVLTSEGARRIEDLKVGDEIVSLDLSDHGRQIAVNVTCIRVAVTAECIRVNGLLTATPTQPVYEAEQQWILLGDVRAGMRLLRGDGSFAVVDHLEKSIGQFSVYEISTHHPSHNFVASGYVCHNIKE